MKTEAQIKNEARGADVEAKRNPRKPPTAMSTKFADLFGMSLPPDFERDWANHHLEFRIYPVLEDVATRWFKSHPGATVFDICRIVTSLLRKHATVIYEDHHSADAMRIRSKYSN